MTARYFPREGKEKIRYFPSESREKFCYFPFPSSEGKKHDLRFFHREGKKLLSLRESKEIFSLTSQVGESSRATAYARRLLPLTP